MNPPVISIIVPVYRTPRAFLHRFIKSTLEQSLSDIELIAVNDASPDHCPEILDAAAAEDPRMIVVHRKVNGRAGLARNDGLIRARGRYVHFADADDYMVPDMCQTLATLAETHGADIVCQSVVLRDPEGRRIGRKDVPDRFYDLNQSRHRARAYNGLTFALWDKLFRRKIIAQISFEQYEANIGEDTLFNVAALCRSRKMLTTSYAGYEYTIHGSSATGRSQKGMAYLRTLAASGHQIRQIIAREDGSRVGRRFADLMDLKRFATGCGWIAQNPDIQEKKSLWDFWRKYFKSEIFAGILSRRALAVWCRAATACRRPETAYGLIWPACRVAGPLSLAMRIQDHLARAVNHCRPTFGKKVPN
jgi:glycosyltransferase involved in cell wall biosynthesis